LLIIKSNKISKNNFNNGDIIKMNANDNNIDKPFFDSKLKFLILGLIIFSLGTVLIEKNIIKKGQVGYFMIFEFVLLIVTMIVLKKYKYL
jgi:hypothetical protein